MSSFADVATVTASTKRAVMTSGIQAEPTENLTSLKCTPLDPVDAELRHSLELETPHELLQTFVDGALDILEGDVLVVGSNEYPIRSCAGWTWDGSEYLHLVLEDLKR